jgi:hypothetical protein
VLRALALSTMPAPSSKTMTASAKAGRMRIA